jgi:hypothetical protein
MNCGNLMVALPVRNDPHDEKELHPRRDSVGQWSVWRLMGQILLAGEEPDERSAFLRDVVADRAAVHSRRGDASSARADSLKGKEHPEHPTIQDVAASEVCGMR